MREFFRDLKQVLKFYFKYRMRKRDFFLIVSGTTASGMMVINSAGYPLWIGLIFPVIFFIPFIAIIVQDYKSLQKFKQELKVEARYPFFQERFNQSN